MNAAKPTPNVTVSICAFGVTPPRTTNSNAWLSHNPAPTVARIAATLRASMSNRTTTATGINRHYVNAPDVTGASFRE